MTIQEMKQMKQEQGISDSYIAELSGIPVKTVQKIFEGQTEGIGYHTWQAVEDVFIDKMMMREGAAAYGAGKKLIRSGGWYISSRERRPRRSIPLTPRSR